MKAALTRALVALGAARFLRWRNRDRLPVLMYHGVVPHPLAPFCWHQLPLAHFERQMAFVAEHYKVFPLEEAMERLHGGHLMPRSLCITFDDGYRNNLMQALPVLERHDLHATIFLATDFVDSDDVLWPDRLYLALRATQQRVWDGSSLGLGILRIASPKQKADALSRVYRAMKQTRVSKWPEVMTALLHSLRTDGGKPDEDFRGLTWNDVEKLKASGRVAFGAHTQSHPILSQADDETVRTQIQWSQRIVSERTGHVPQVFAYPNGRTQDFDKRAQHVLRDLDVPYALTTEHGLIDRLTPLQALPRICVGADLSFPRFQLLVAGR